MDHVSVMVFRKSLHCLGLSDARLAEQAQDDLVPALVGRLDEAVHLVDILLHLGIHLSLYSIDRLYR